MSDSKECKIIDTINITDPQSIITTPCGKFLIGIESQSIYCYNIETKQKFRITGSVKEKGHQDGTRDASRFNNPLGLSLSKDLKTLFVADTDSNVIRSICVETGITSTFAGQIGKFRYVNGSKENVCFKFPRSLQLSPDGNILYVSDACRLRSICIETGQVNTVLKCLNVIYDFIFSPDAKHLYICEWNTISKINLETNESNIISKCLGLLGCDISKDGQFLCISIWEHKCIRIFDIGTNCIIDTILTCFENEKVSICEKQLYICEYNKVQIIDISKYCINFKIFTQFHISKHSFLPRQVVTSFFI